MVGDHDELESVPAVPWNDPDGSVEGLAVSLGMDAAALKAAVEAHNAEAPAKFATAPFYALGPAKSYVVLTDGGLAVNNDLQLLGEGDKPVPGLYAAGSAGQGGVGRASVNDSDETPTTRTLRLTRTDGELPPFRPGQYVSLQVEIDGLRTSRPYSMSSAPGTRISSG